MAGSSGFLWFCLWICHLQRGQRNDVYHDTNINLEASRNQLLAGLLVLNHKNCKLIPRKERFGERLSTQIITICFFKLPTTYLYTADSYMLSYALSVVVNAISKTLKRELNLFFWY